jgi:hypothetical protein
MTVLSGAGVSGQRAPGCSLNSSPDPQTVAALLLTKLLDR